MTPSRPRVALVFPTRNEENLYILQGVAAFARTQTDWSLFLDDQTRAADDPNWLFEAEWDGVLYRYEHSRTLLEACAERGVPCIDLSDGAGPLPGVHQVRPNNPAMGAAGARHFIEQGYRNLAFAGLGERPWSLGRQQGFIAEAEAAGYKVAIFSTDYLSEVTPNWEREEELALAAWVSSLPKPLGIMACNDLRGLEVLRACARAGIRVPNEVGVLGANDETTRCELADPELSSASVDARLWGYTAAKLLAGYFQGHTPQGDVTLLGDPRITRRRSTDVTLVDDKAVARALELIHQRPQHDLDPGTLAKKVGLSRRSLERRFRKELKRSPQDEIRAACLRRVQELLRDTNQTVSEVAELTGFRNPEYLTVFFKRMTGETPREYRARRVPR
jgi:LacI family transcriptional regulator